MPVLHAGSSAGQVSTATMGHHRTIPELETQRVLTRHIGQDEFLTTTRMRKR